MRRLRKVVATVGAAALLAIAVAGCRPKVEFSNEPRASQLDALDVTASVQPDGTVAITETVTFAGDDGGTVELPGPVGSSETLPGVREVTVDGEPAETRAGTFGTTVVRIAAEQATVAFVLTGAIDRYIDIAVLDYPVVASPDDARRHDPDIALSGALTIPGAGDAAAVDAHLLAGRDREVAVDGESIRFTSRAPIWTDGALLVAFPAGVVPGLPVTPIEQRAMFATNAATREGGAASLERTLGSLDDQLDLASWIIFGLAIGLPGFFWGRALLHAARVKLEQRREVRDVPDHVREPPSTDSPAVVSVLEGNATPEREAVAGTLLALAGRQVIRVDEYGPDRLVVKVPADGTAAADECERIVLEALRAEADGAGAVEGPPVWRKRTTWWRGFERAAIGRARESGYVVSVLPLLSISGAVVTTAVGVSIYFFSRPWVMFAGMFAAQFLAVALWFVSGRDLSASGRRQRALWRAFSRYIHDHGELAGVGPSGVAVWGPYVVYGVVLGEADDAARVLTP